MCCADHKAGLLSISIIYVNRYSRIFMSSRVYKERDKAMQMTTDRS